MVKHGRGGGAPGKGNPGGARGGNRGGDQDRLQMERKGVTPRSSQSFGKDPHRGEPEG